MFSPVGKQNWEFRDRRRFGFANRCNFIFKLYCPRVLRRERLLCLVLVHHLVRFMLCFTLGTGFVRPDFPLLALFAFSFDQYILPLAVL